MVYNAMLGSPILNIIIHLAKLIILFNELFAFYQSLFCFLVVKNNDEIPCKLQNALITHIHRLLSFRKQISDMMSWRLVKGMLLLHLRIFSLEFPTAKFLIIIRKFLQQNFQEAFNCVHHNKLWKILKEMGIPDHLTCLLRNLSGQEATVRTGHGTTDCFQIGKGVCQGCILSPCLFNFYMQSTSGETLG